MNYNLLVDKIQNTDPLAIAYLISIFCFLACIYSLYFQYKVKKWPSCLGTLIHGEVSKFGANENELSEQDYSAEVRYEYEVNGKKYVGNRLSAMVVIASHNARAVLSKQLEGIERQGDKVKVYYNPNRAYKSFLINGSKIQVIFTISMLLFALAVSLRCLEMMKVI
jgi:hypothetical protein